MNTINYTFDASSMSKLAYNPYFKMYEFTAKAVSHSQSVDLLIRFKDYEFNGKLSIPTLQVFIKSLAGYREVNYIHYLKSYVFENNLIENIQKSIVIAHEIELKNILISKIENISISKIKINDFTKLNTAYHEIPSNYKLSTEDLSARYVTYENGEGEVISLTMDVVVDYRQEERSPTSDPQDSITLDIEYDKIDPSLLGYDSFFKIYRIRQEDADYINSLMREEAEWNEGDYDDY